VCVKKQDANILLEKNKIIERQKILLEEKDKLIEEKDKLIEKLFTMIQPIIKKINNLILNDITIIVREDGYINLTQLCKAGEKEFYKWNENKNSKEFLQVLSSSLRIRMDDLIKYETGSNENKATWGHPQVAINIAQWISPQFNVQVSKWVFELNIAGKVELGNEKSNKELEYLYQEKINNLQNKLNNYETTIFNRNIDYCPIEYYGKDIVYFIKFNIPSHLHSEYMSKYPNIDNKDYSCIEFGVSSDLEKRLISHKRDRKKDNLIFLHAIELKKRYTASKMEFYIKRIAYQLNVKFDYEKKKECVLVNEEMFNILVNKINTSLLNLEDECEENEIEEIEEIEDEEEKTEIFKYKYDIELKKLDNDIELKKLDNDIELKKLEKEKEIKKIEMITELIKNKLITIDEFKNMLVLLK
jgi:hypothetical protein